MGPSDFIKGVELPIHSQDLAKSLTLTKTMYEVLQSSEAALVDIQCTLSKQSMSTAQNQTFDSLTQIIKSFRATLAMYDILERDIYNGGLK